MQKRDIITSLAVDVYRSYDPDVLVTSCPLCKKTFNRINKMEVRDLAEIVAWSLPTNTPTAKHDIRSKLKKSEPELV
jgi:Fe-S oxidoreductase